MAKFPSNQKLTFWAENGLNVLFTGPHGVGKTAMAELTFNEIFGERGKDWLYFSAATMDPWVDFVGVPKERKSEDGVSYLELVRPEVFARDQVKAIIFDEFNRAPKKVRNAVMELMQFQSINGHKFENLQCIWAAVNPAEDDENNYDVEEIDPAQRDRFHVFYEFGYDVSIPYFAEKYGDKGKLACDWWKGLTDELKKAVSPRRLDYCMKVYTLGGSIKDILPAGVPCQDLLSQLKSGSFLTILENIKNGSVSQEEIAEHLKDQNFFNYAEGKIKESNDLCAVLMPSFSSEQVVKFFKSNSIDKMKSVLNMLDEDNTNEDFIETLRDIYNSTEGHIAQTKRSKIGDWLIKHGGLYEYNGDSKDMKEFLSNEPENVHDENTHHRTQRLQHFINYVGDNGLEDLKRVEELHKAVVRNWLVMLSRSQEKTLANELLERVGTSLNFVKKNNNKKNLIEFFKSSEFNEVSDDKIQRNLEAIVECLTTGKKLSD